MCLVVFGFRGVESEISRGEFYCLQCASEKPYVHTGVKRWFTFFFVPVIPLNDVGSYIRCLFCQSDFNPIALNYGPPAQQQRSFKLLVNDAVKRLMVGIVCADGEVDPKEADLAVALGQAVIGPAYGHDYFTQDVERFKNQDFMASLRTVGGQIDEASRELLLRVAVLLATADDKLDQTEKSLINRMALALGVPEQRVPGVISEAVQFGLQGPPQPIQGQPAIT